MIESDLLTDPPFSKKVLASILNDAPSGIIIINGTGSIIYASQQVVTLFGFSRQELIGQQVEMLVPEMKRETHVLDRAKFMGSPSVKLMGEGLNVEGVTKVGHSIPIEVKVSYIETDAGLLFSAFIREDLHRYRTAFKARMEKEGIDAT